jgi:TolB protein
VPLTGASVDAESPSWSPDGARIAYQSTVSGVTYLFIINADGSNPHRVSTASTFEETPDWRP